VLGAAAGLCWGPPPVCAGGRRRSVLGAAAGLCWEPPPVCAGSRRRSVLGATYQLNLAFSKIK